MRAKTEFRGVKQQRQRYVTLQKYGIICDLKLLFFYYPAGLDPEHCCLARRILANYQAVLTSISFNRILEKSATCFVQSELVTTSRL